MDSMEDPDQVLGVLCLFGKKRGNKPVQLGGISGNREYIQDTKIKRSEDWTPIFRQRRVLKKSI